MKEIEFLDYRQIGPMLKQSRREQNITQQELADDLGLSRIGIGKIEKENHDVKLSTLTKIVDYLGYDLVLKRKER